jgi:hypothetical protein
VAAVIVTRDNIVLDHLERSSISPHVTACRTVRER